MRIFTNISILLLALALVACSSKNKAVTGESFFGKEENKMEKKAADDLAKDFFSKLPPAIQNDYWPRNGYVPGENLAFTEKYKYSTSSAGSEPEEGFALTSGPIVAEEKIFTLGGKGEVEARDINKTSRVIWKVTLDESGKKEDGLISKTKSLFTDNNKFIGGNLCYSLGKIYVTTKRGSLFVIDAKDGKVIWNKNYSTIIRSTPVVREDKILFVTSDNRAVSVSTKDGSIIWSHAGLLENSKVMSSPAPLLIGNKVIITYSSGEVFALDFNKGNELWSAELSKSSYGALSAFMNDIGYSPVSYKGRIYIVSSDGTLNALNESGENVWSFEGEAINNAVWPVGDFLFTTTRYGELLAISSISGKLVWKVSMADPKKINDDELHFTAVVMAAGKLYAADNNGTLYAFSSQTGETIKTTSIPDDVILPPVVAEGRILLITRSSKLIVME